MKRVVITGVGLIAPGTAKEADRFARGCFQGQGNIVTCELFSTEGLSTDKFGEAVGLKYDTKALNGRLCALQEIAIRAMLKSAKVTPQETSSWGQKCRMFIGSLIFSADSFLQHEKANRRNAAVKTTKNNFIPHMNDYIREAKKLTGVRGNVTVASSSCSSGVAGAGMAMDFIRNGFADAAVVGGVDPLSVMTAYGFHSLKSMTNSVTNPFDETRDGINIAECAAFFMAESLDHALERKADIYAELSGYALGNDAYHITSPEPNGEGACRVMEAALSDAGITPDDICYINAHGTGTIINDSMESKAIQRVFANIRKPVPVSSTKALIGHAMGASGAIELASVIFALKEQRYIPMPRLANCIVKDEKFIFSDQPMPLKGDYALKNSFAFSGNSASIVVKRYEGNGCV